MDTQTQNEYIYNLLLERGSEGILSEERFNGGVFAGQLPRCISDLENKENPKREKNPMSPKWKLKGMIEHKPEGKYVRYILHKDGQRDLELSFYEPEPKKQDLPNLFTNQEEVKPDPMKAQFYIKEGKFYARL